jgi:isoleucyl-tRNA synthetase
LTWRWTGRRSSPPGYAVAEADGLLVALNTTLTPELELEGQARDLVRYVQDARKAAGLDISDRIALTLQPAAGVDLRALLAAYGDYVRAETLAESVEVGQVEAGASTAKAELDRDQITLGLRRVSAPVAAGPAASTG